MLIPTGAEQPQGALQPVPTPPPSAEVLKFPSETAAHVGLRLDVYSPSQVLQTNGCFYHSPLPPWVSENRKQQGPFAPRTLLRFLATTGPSATLSSSIDFLGSPVIRLPAPPISRRDEEGFSLSASLSSCCRLTPRQSVPSLQSVAPVHVAFALSVRARPLEFSVFEATYAFTFVAAR